MGKSLMGLKEFQALSGLSDSAFLELLRGEILRVELDSSGRIMVDPSSVDLSQLVSSIVTHQNEELQSNTGLLREKIGNIILGEMDRIITDVCARLSRSQSGNAEG